MMNDENTLKSFVEQTESLQSNQSSASSKPVIDDYGVDKPWLKSKDQVEALNDVGWQIIPLDSLPSLGLFYPSDTKIYIRSATGGEIRHWSTLNEEDLSSLDDMLNYIVERCVNVKSGTRMLSWKDIKEIDRFYLLLAIREFTFIKGENKLTVKVSESKKIDVRKEMIDYINFDQRLLKYYSEEERCFVLKFKNGSVIRIEIPSVGVTSWLKTYIQRKNQQQQQFDQDFVSFAPFVIRDWRGLNEQSYEQMIYESMQWGPSEISVLSDVRQIFQDTINPVIKYKDESGAELVAPLSFQGGVKSILLVSDSFSELV